jgi:hypothetical protein
MSAESLYDALYETIEEQSDLDDPLSMMELIGAIEMVKHDILRRFDGADHDGDDDPEPMDGACCIPDAA